MDRRLRTTQLRHENAWFSGKRRMSGQTAQRFVELAPKIMSKDERFKAALAIRNTHVRKNIIYKRYRLRVSRKLSSKSIQNATRRAIDDALTIANRRDNDTWKKLAAWLARRRYCCLGTNSTGIRKGGNTYRQRGGSPQADEFGLPMLSSECRIFEPGNPKRSLKHRVCKCSLRLVGIEPEMDKKEERERNKKDIYGGHLACSLLLWL